MAAVAESYRAERNDKEARDAYLAVYRAYPKTRAGEAALYEAGALALEHLGDPKAAAGDFKTYLTRYPKGPRRKEAYLSLQRAELKQGDRAAAAATRRAYEAEFPGESHFAPGGFVPAPRK
jgi:TolA-binding protein